MIETRTFTGAKPGPTLLILGGVHGNEPCGAMAVERLMADLDGGRVALDSGMLICAPRVNRAALDRDLRFIDANLNRILGAYDPDTAEAALVPPLRALLEKCYALLDLHSYSAGGPPFVFAADDAATMGFARAMPAAAIITGWQQAQAAADPANAATAGMGTTEYARARGACAITFECGGHADPASPENGYRAARAALAHFALAADIPNETKPSPPAHLVLAHIFFRRKPGALARAWRHLDPIRAGETFARHDDGTVLAAPMDGFVVLPAKSASLGSEWGYLAAKNMAQKETGPCGPAS
ncbi:MAG: succinylglutamate desuccinylase/aspartoacylase family protein [Rhodospirillales bacterium]|nr:succinylglutamate desuccinylase/aspartoacylase family protein [Alphaproteobacteria bacterium]MCB9986046.1 succinylglutamate desuccinylase/aspartoacylase family protein [Rhodospirillales bacterium]USO07383.1 MAG: succinylglutamate desuccinylase/aspartoacylase family protein [Rhodospirillales bacterium]